MDVGALTEEADWIFGLLEGERPYPPTADELMCMTMEDEDVTDAAPDPKRERCARFG